MIPIQLWRARIGLFNVKCYSADPRSNSAFRLEKLTIPSTAHSPKGDSSPIPSTIKHVPASSDHEHKCAFSSENSSSDESTTVFVSIKQQQSADGKHFSARTLGSKAVYSLLSSLNTDGILYSLIFIGMHVILTGCFSLLGVGSSYFACRAPASSASMISVEIWRARIGQFHAKCSFKSSLYCFAFLFNMHCRWHRDNEKDAIPPLTTAVATKSSSTSNPTPTPTSPASFSCSSTTCSSSWSGVLFSFLPSCSLSYYSGVCRSVRESALVILLIAGIISHQLIICAGDVETNPGPIACEWYKNATQCS